MFINVFLLDLMDVDIFNKLFYFFDNKYVIVIGLVLCVVGIFCCDDVDFIVCVRMVLLCFDMCNDICYVFVC